MAQSAISTVSQGDDRAAIWRTAFVRWLSPPTAWLAVVACVALGACATATPGRQGQLSSYEGIARSKARRTQAFVMADGPVLKAARTFELEPIVFMDGVGLGVSPAQRALVANVASRVLCEALSERFTVPEAGQIPDLRVRARITGFVATNRGLAAASFVLDKVSPLPMTPRIPAGMGSFSAEGEALDPAGRQAAALTWARGADAFTTGAKVSAVGDAYELAEMFGRDMGQLLVRGEDPVRDLSLPSLPRHRKTDASCDRFGKGPGVKGFVAAHFAAPPDWSDRAPATP